MIAFEQLINNLATTPVYFINIEDYLIPCNCAPKIDDLIELTEDEFSNVVITFENIGKIMTNGVIFKKELSVLYTEEFVEESIEELVESSTIESSEKSIEGLVEQSIEHLNTEPNTESNAEPNTKPNEQNRNNNDVVYTDEYETHKILFGVTLISFVIGTMYYFFKKK